MIRWLTVRLLRVSSHLRKEPERSALVHIAEELAHPRRRPPIRRRVPGTAPDGPR